MHGRIRAFPAVLAAAALAATALAATACGSATSTAASGSRVNLRAVPVTAQQQQALAADDEAFARALWNALGSHEGNVLYTPPSIATALQMAYVGARGETAAEMATALHLGTGATSLDVAAAASKLLAQLAPLAHDRHSLVALADSVWLQRDFAVLPDFRAAMSTGFTSAFHAADFERHGEQARKAINAAIAAQTHDRIRDLLAPGTDLRAARLVLTNAVYLKAAWAMPFEPGSTAPAAFTRTDGTVVRPETMTATGEYGYAATSGYQAIRLPYAGGRLAMTLLLPAAGRPLSWPASIADFRSRTVDLALPKFRFSWDANLAGVLGGLGMPNAFTDQADFSGMSKTPLNIGAVQHKAFIAIDEYGTEAAAATGVVAVGSAAHAPTPLAQLHFDRPFLFRIDDTVTGLPLFLGKVADPTLSA